MKKARSANKKLDAEYIRLGVVAAFMTLGLVFLAYSLHQIQIVKSAEYADAQDAHSFRRVRLPATRGLILDRNGEILADNKPSYSVALYIEELRKPGAWSNTVNHVSGLVDEISRIIDKPREVNKDEIWAHILRRRAIPLFAFKGLSETQLAKLQEWPGALPGTDVYVGSERVYPQGDLASHVIGYVGRGQPRSVEEEKLKAMEQKSTEEADETFNYYFPDLAGREGIEYSCDSALAGVGGGQLIRVNAIGYKHEVMPSKPAVAGADVVLTLDAQLQRVAEHALDGKRGAAVVLDCQNGDILAFASAPRYNLQDFVPVLTSETWNTMLKNPDKPLYHRAASGIYPPGSVFKPVVALCGLGQGVVHEHDHYTCVGYYQVGPRKIYCSHRYGHGELDLQHAIAVSCNPFMIDFGMRMGYEPALHDLCARMGVGKAPKIGIRTSAGILPSKAWKQKRFKEGWRGGDTANLSIGQGYLAMTPLQVALMTSILAMDGKVIAPRLIRDAGDGRGVQDQPVVTGTIKWPADDLRLVKAGMYDALNAYYGTGRRAIFGDISAAGKTGTAEYMEGGLRKKHAWMIAYAPAEAPRYAIAIVCEDSDAGGLTAAFVLRKIFARLFPDAEGANLVEMEEA